MKTIRTIKTIQTKQTPTLYQRSSWQDQLSLPDVL